jgi:hypothetical protein
MESQDVLKGLSDTDLIFTHARSHNLEKSSEALIGHHLLCHEMLKRGIDPAHADGDAWLEPVEMSRQERVSLKALVQKSLPSELLSALNDALSEGTSFADVIGLLTVNGYTFSVAPLDAAAEVAAQAENDRQAAINCPDCAMGCIDGDDCECWDGCQCPDCPEPQPTLLDNLVDAIAAKLGLGKAKAAICPDCTGGCPCKDNKTCSCAPSCICIACPGTKTATKSVAVMKSVKESMFTLSPAYVPDQLDAHDEWTDGNTLQKGMWDYVKSGNRDIYLQHNPSIVAGEWVEAMTMPFEFTMPMVKAVDGTAENVTYPAGTVLMGVMWKKWAWELVKSGEIRGLSMGGKAARIFQDLPTKKSKGDAPVEKASGSIEVQAQDLAEFIGKLVKSNLPTMPEQVIQVVMPEVVTRRSTKIERDADGLMTRIVEE